jgi:hypothetical protein
MRRWYTASGALVAAIGLSLGIGFGCATGRIELARYAYFDHGGERDAWSAKISAWQRREHDDQGDAFSIGLVPSVDGPPLLAGEGAAPGDDLLTLGRSAFWDAGEPLDLPDVPESAIYTAPDTARDPARAAALEPSDLRSKYFGFRAERRRAMARDLGEWVRGQAKQHYVADGPVDHWATLEETLREDGDDCDGLELLTFHALRDLGFDPRAVYRAIVYRPSDGQHHMVTLWFERRDDPWVLDPTGAMTDEMLRMSQLPDWVPIKLFSDTTEFTVVPDDSALGATRFAVNP